MSITKLAKKPILIAEVERRLQLTPAEFKKEVAELRKTNEVRIFDGFVHVKPKREESDFTVDNRKIGRCRVAMISDLHFGSRWCDADGIVNFLSRIHSMGIRDVLVPGDVIDGVKPLLLPEQDFARFDTQLDFAVKTIRRAPKGLRFYAIAGNHDSYTSHAIGFEAGRALSDAMKCVGVDWNYLGECLGHMTLHGARIQLWHPHGGASTSNAVRRILNTRIEHLVSPVDMLVIGHFHKYAVVHAYPENVMGVASGTFQRKGSEFSNRLTTDWSIGGTVLSWTRHPDGSVGEFSSEFHPDSR